jgi:hypothetical protein
MTISGYLVVTKHDISGYLPREEAKMGPLRVGLKGPLNGTQNGPRNGVESGQQDTSARQVVSSRILGKQHPRTGPEMDPEGGQDRAPKQAQKEAPLRGP